MVLHTPVQILHQQGQKPVQSMLQTCFEQHPNGTKPLCKEGKAALHTALLLHLAWSAGKLGGEAQRSARLTEFTKSYPGGASISSEKQCLGQCLNCVLLNLAETQQSSCPSDVMLSTGWSRHEGREETLPCKGPLSLLLFLLFACLGRRTGLLGGACRLMSF